MTERVYSAGILGKLLNARWAVPRVKPVSLQIAPHERPWARSVAILAAFHGDPGPSELPALRLGVSNACAHTLADQAALEFCNGAEDRKDHLPGGRAGVHLL